jgi:hypothetical protein
MESSAEAVYQCERLEISENLHFNDIIDLTDYLRKVRDDRKAVRAYLKSPGTTLVLTAHSGHTSAEIDALIAAGGGHKKVIEVCKTLQQEGVSVPNVPALLLVLRKRLQSDKLESALTRAAEQEMMRVYMMSDDCGLLAQHKEVPYTDEEMDVLLEACGGTAAVSIPEYRYLDKYADGAELPDLEHLAGAVKKLREQKLELLDFMHKTSNIFKGSQIITQEDLVLGDINDLYVHGECGTMTMHAIEELDSKGLRCESLSELIKQMKKWRAGQERVLADRKMLADFLTRPACKLFAKNPDFRMLANDIDAIITVCDENVVQAVKECSYQESVGLRVQSLDELRTIIMETRHQRATLRQFLISSTLFLDSPMENALSEDDVFKIFSSCGGLHALNAAKMVKAAGERCTDVHDLIMKMQISAKEGTAAGSADEYRTPVHTPPEFKRPEPAVETETTGEGITMDRYMGQPEDRQSALNLSRGLGGMGPLPSPIAEGKEEEEKHDSETGGPDTKRRGITTAADGDGAVSNPISPATQKSVTPVAAEATPILSRDPTPPFPKESTPPITTEPILPTATSPTPPIITDTTPPGTNKPSQPISREPTPPAVTKPVSPAAKLSTPPAATKTVSPALREPTPPSTQQPTPPSTKAPTPPSTKDPTSASTKEPVAAAKVPTPPSTKDPTSASTKEPVAAAKVPTPPSTKESTPPSTREFVAAAKVSTPPSPREPIPSSMKKPVAAADPPSPVAEPARKGGFFSSFGRKKKI